MKTNAMNEYQKLKDNLEKAYPYHKKYDRFLNSLDCFGIKRIVTLGEDDFGKPLTIEEKAKPDLYLMSKRDIAYLQAKGYIDVSYINSYTFDINLSPIGLIFLVEDEGFLGNADNRKNKAMQAREQYKSNYWAVRIAIITTIISIIAILSQEDNSLGALFRSIFNCN